MFLAPGDARLNERASEVCPCHISSEEIQQAINVMYEVAYDKAKDRSRPILVGLAAPQIGIQKRVILVDISSDLSFSNLKEFINPVILWRSDEIEIGREGCFSTDQIYGLVPRSKKVLIWAYDRNGNTFSEEYEDFVARILQHEIDHLDGIRFPDRMSEDTPLHWVEEEQMPKYRIHWADWPITIGREDWRKMKEGS